MTSIQETELENTNGRRAGASLADKSRSPERGFSRGRVTGGGLSAERLRKQDEDDHADRIDTIKSNIGKFRTFLINFVFFGANLK